MFLLDTNILSEFRKGANCAPSVIGWAESLDINLCFISVLSLGEIRKGIEIIRRTDQAQASSLETWHDNVKHRYEHRTLEISDIVANRWGMLMAEHTRPISDALLAATAIEWNLTLVTRNTKDFQNIPPLKLFDPFKP